METTAQQKAINDFFEGFGSDTVKEYGQSFLDIIQVAQTKKLFPASIEEDISSKFNSLFRLISNLKPADLN